MPRSHAVRDPHARRTRALWAVAAVAVVFTCTLLPAATAPDVAGAAGASLSVVPSTALVDGTAVSVVISGVTPGSVYVVVECDPTAFTLLAAHASPADGCDSRYNAAVTTDAGGVAATVLHLPAVPTTALGSGDCRRVRCLVAAESLYSPGTAPLMLQDVSFVATACTARGACRTPSDAWDPTLGPATTADDYQVTLAAEAPASSGGLSWPLGPVIPAATVVDAQLEVVDPSNPQYLATAYAPVFFGRSTSALHDVTLLVDATAVSVAGGATDLSYTVIWSHDDAGTGSVPFVEWGTRGRMTDIEDAISFAVAADGTVSDASCLWGGEPATGFPDSHGALQEVDQPFVGTWDGTHPVLRDGTGNNDCSAQGSTPFRFQLAPVPGPAAGQTRESVMDARPFTYRVSGEEALRWYGDISTDPQSPEPGDARQYATVDLGATGSGVTSLAVELQFSGGPDWYASDEHMGYPAHGTGHFRTVVKLPLGWQQGLE